MNLMYSLTFFCVTFFFTFPGYIIFFTHLHNRFFKKKKTICIKNIKKEIRTFAVKQSSTCTNTDSRSAMNYLTNINKAKSNIMP